MNFEEVHHILIPCDLYHWITIHLYYFIINCHMYCWFKPEHRDYILSKSRFISTQILFVFLSIIVSSDWLTVSSQRQVLKLCPQFSAASPLIWESWTWVTTTCRTQEWSSFLLDWKVHTLPWKLSGQDSPTCSTNHHLNCDLYEDINTWVYSLLKL